MFNGKKRARTAFEKDPHGYNFQKLSSIIRTHNEPHSEVAQIKLHLFDAICSETFHNRWSIINDMYIDSDHVKLTETRSVKDSETIKNCFQSFVNDNYEGLMVRVDYKQDKNNNYYRKGMRSRSLLKYKSFDQEEFVCIGLNEQDSTEDTLGSVTLLTKEGKEFQASAAFSDEQKKELWDNRELYTGVDCGYIATVKYQGLSTDNIPRFPILIGFRYEDDT